MSEEDIKNKNLVLIDYLRSLINNYVVRAEYSTNDNANVSGVVLQMFVESVLM